MVFHVIVSVRKGVEETVEMYFNHITEDLSLAQNRMIHFPGQTSA